MIAEQLTLHCSNNNAPEPWHPKKVAGTGSYNFLTAATVQHRTLWMLKF